MLWGYPSSMNADYAALTPWGQLAGALIMFVVLGFIPGYLCAGLLNALGRLRIPREIELAGLDFSDNAAVRADTSALQAAELAATRELN